MADSSVAGQVLFKAAEDVSVAGNAFYPKLIYKQERSTKNRTVSFAKTLAEFNTQTTQAGVLFDFIVVEPLVTGWGTAGKTNMLVSSTSSLVPADLTAFNIFYDGETLTVPTATAPAAAYTFKTGTPTLVGSTYSGITTPNVVTVTAVIADAGTNLAFAELLFGTVVKSKVSVKKDATTVVLTANIESAGTNIVTVRVTDNAGNVSTPSVAVTLTSV